MPLTDPQRLYLWSTVFATDRDLELRRAVAEVMIAEGKVDRADLQRWQEGLRSGVEGWIIGMAVGLAISFPVLRLYPVRNAYLRLPMRALSTFSGGTAGFAAVSYHVYRQYGYTYGDDEIDRLSSVSENIRDEAYRRGLANPRSLD
ncbi:hypothetical protein HD553DRAFT_352304 [Filobasidium floriforme]|uniref:uncharacterized protein n=1 Tax=Filobasidium floriforme TaxID=5210 RepID=UPI001E8EA196|nr:uncharacterized protein HD553DRAFT_352304 [Filobasidium floriforme]KAH8080226.1 hypothetical protein HD553DRAFT_352304 [Filobasidium floriforme]